MLKGSRKGSRRSGTAEHPWGGKIMHFVDTVVFHVGKSQQVGGFPRLHAQIRVLRIASDGLIPSSHVAYFEFPSNGSYPARLCCCRCLVASEFGAKQVCKKPILKSLNGKIAILRVSFNFHIPCLQEARWHVFLVLILLHPGLELNRAFILCRRQSQLPDDLFE